MKQNSLGSALACRLIKHRTAFQASFSRGSSMLFVLKAAGPLQSSRSVIGADSTNQNQSFLSDQLMFVSFQTILARGGALSQG